MKIIRYTKIFIYITDYHYKVKCSGFIAFSHTALA